MSTITYLVFTPPTNLPLTLALQEPRWIPPPLHNLCPTLMSILPSLTAPPLKMKDLWKLCPLLAIMGRNPSPQFVSTASDQRHLSPLCFAILLFKCLYGRCTQQNGRACRKQQRKVKKKMYFGTDAVSETEGKFFSMWTVSLEFWCQLQQG